MMFNVANAKRIESKGSWWWFDDTSMMYIRSPKGERPREREEWGSEEAGVLQDFKAHPYVWFAVKPHEWVEYNNVPRARLRPAGLLIGQPDGTTSYAPMPDEFWQRMVEHGEQDDYTQWAVQ